MPSCAVVRRHFVAIWMRPGRGSIYLKRETRNVARELLFQPVHTCSNSWHLFAGGNQTCSARSPSERLGARPGSSSIRGCCSSGRTRNQAHLGRIEHARTRLSRCAWNRPPKTPRCFLRPLRQHLHGIGMGPTGRADDFARARLSATGQRPTADRRGPCLKSSGVIRNRRRHASAKPNWFRQRVGCVSPSRGLVDCRARIRPKLKYPARRNRLPI